VLWRQHARFEAKLTLNVVGDESIFLFLIPEPTQRFYIIIAHHCRSLPTGKCTLSCCRIQELHFARYNS